MTALTELVARRDLLFNLTRAELTARYRTTALGVLWFLLTPLILMVVLTVVFAYVIDLGIPDYPVFVLAGLLPFTFFQVALLNAATSVTRSSGLVKRASMPRLYLPLSAISANLIHYVISLVLLLPLMLAFGVPLTPGLLLLPLAIGLAVMATAGVGLLAAGLNVAHRDVELMLSAGTRVLFYVSPVFYPISSVPEPLLPFYLLNPIAGVIAMHRSLLLAGEMPPLEVTVITTITCTLTLLAGLIVFARRQADFEDYL